MSVMCLRTRAVAALLVGAGTIALALPAHAQGTPQSPADPQPAGAPPSAAEPAPAGDQQPGAPVDNVPAPPEANSAATTEADVVVTGSRVIANGNNSPTPLTVVSTQQLLEATPGSLGQALQQLPVFQGSLGQNTGTGGSTGGPNGTASSVNIRNIGLYRTLVLVDGRRVQPTSNTGLITIDFIPQMLLQRVDVVTGGVSAVYGSDAISGVVNFVTDRNFNGVSVKAQRGISELGDDPITDLGIAAGTDLFGGRAHFEGSFEYFDDPGVLSVANSSRRLGNLYALEGAVPGSTAVAGSQTNPYKLYSNVRLSTTTFGGLIRSGPLAGQNFTADGVLSPFVNGGATGTIGFQTGGDGGYYYNSSLKGQLKARRAFGRFDFDVTDGLHLFVEGIGAANQNAFQNQSIGFNNVAVRSQSPFLSPQYRYGTATNTFTISQIPLNIGPNRSRFDVTSWYVTGGLEGKIGDRLKWELGASHGYSQQNWNNLNNANFQKLSAALDAVTDPATGATVCNVTLTNPSLYPGCQPLNLFGPTAASAAALDYVTDYTQSWATTKLDNVLGSVTGSLFDTWAGPVNAALSGEWRKTTFETVTQVPPGFANCTGLRFNCTATTARTQITFARVAPVSQEVYEVALEGDVPLLKDVPFAQSVSVNLAGRYAHYDTSGHAWTWKVGLDWQVSDELRLRATRSRDFHAPNLNDLYAAETISRANVVDQLTGATLINQAFSTTGNPNLKPEVGNTLTFGVVYKPAWVPGASLSVDFFDIRITNAITAINGTNASVQRACNASGGTSSICSLIVRPLAYSNTTTANNATFFYNSPVNASELRSRGADIEANYATQVAGQPLSLRALVTWQPLLRQATPGIGTQNVSGYAFSTAGLTTTPKWRATAFLNYNLADEIRLGIVQRWRSALKWNADPLLYYSDPKIPAFGWTNASLTFAPKAGWARSEFYVNVTNILDNKPPLATNSTANPGVLGAYISTDDFIGRYYTAGVRVKF